MRDDPETPPPRRFRRIIERVCDRDREALARHPETDRVMRPYVLGEAHPMDDPAWTHVLITAVIPGVRVRRPGVLQSDTFHGSGLEIVDQDDPNLPGRIVPPAGTELLGMVDCREGSGR